MSIRIYRASIPENATMGQMLIAGRRIRKSIQADLKDVPHKMCRWDRWRLEFPAGMSLRCGVLTEE
jgi:hypothetical protein